MTRRGMLSIFRSICDTLGFLTPFILKDKRLLQLLLQYEIGWDERVDDSIINELLLWKISLEGHEIIRCFKPSGFGKIRNFGCIIFQMHLKKDMVKSAISEW